MVGHLVFHGRPYALLKAQSVGFPFRGGKEMAF